MANRTVAEAIHIHGTNPQNLIEKITRNRIYDSLYWKEECFGLTAETIIDKAVMLTEIGGYTANQKPTKFMCLVLKVVLLQPSKDIVIEYIKNEDFKYLRALAAFYFRLTGSAKEIYQYLEPLLNDYRKLRKHTPTSTLLTYMDEFIDELLTNDRACEIILPRLNQRHVLEELGELDLRVSMLEELLEEEDLESHQMSRNESDAESDKAKSDEYEDVKIRDIRKNGKEEKRRKRSRSPSDENRHRLQSKRYERNRSYGRSRSRNRSQDRRSRDMGRRRRSRSRSRSRSRGRRRDVRTEREVGREHKKKKYSQKKLNSLMKKSSKEKQDYEGINAAKGETGRPGGHAESLSVEETNKLRISLGLKSLKG